MPLFSCSFPYSGTPTLRLGVATGHRISEYADRADFPMQTVCVSERIELMDFQKLTFRRFNGKDQPGVIGVIAECYREYGQAMELETLDDDLRRIREIYESPGSMFHVLVDAGCVVGTVAVKRVSSNEAELKRLFLDARYRERGLGKRMTLWAIDWASERGYETLHIWSDVLYTKAHELYRRLGADDTGQRRFLGGVDRIDEFYFSIRDLQRWSATRSREEENGDSRGTVRDDAER